MHQNCQWLTAELRQLTIDYLAPEKRRYSPTSWFIGFPEAPVIDPGSITRHPNRLCKLLTPYQQEDAHEFLRALLGTLVLQGQNKELSSLFDGLLESAVTCQCCYRPSLTRDRYMDLSLDILSKNVRTLHDALSDFTDTETLTGDNSVYCRHCKGKRTATKGLRLATAPSILVCHFKRFAYDEYGRLVRLKKHVSFPPCLEIGNYMSRVNRARPPPYELVAVLVHQGNTCDSGHYLAYVKHASQWYKCNDALVEPVCVELVLQQQAYMVLYEVADMRANHGFVQEQKAPPPEPFFCGLDTNFVTDICGSWNRPWQRPKPKTRRRRPRESRDDLSTIGESTVETENSKRRFRRSSSSGNLRNRGWKELPPRKPRMAPRLPSHRRVLSSENVR